MHRHRAAGAILLSVPALAVLVWLTLERVGNSTEAPSRSTRPVVSAAATAETHATLPSREEESGRLVYERYCVYCHGRAADGFGINAPKLRLEPPALAGAPRSTATADRQVADRVADGGSAHGVPGGCPPWGRRLGTGNVQAVVAYLRWLADTAASSP